MRVILKPSPTFSTVQAASVSTRRGVAPARSRPTLSAMLKHAACAAASSSSGFEPGASSNRDPNEYFPPRSVCPRYEPFPPRSPPSQTAVAFLVGISALLDVDRLIAAPPARLDARSALRFISSA